MEGTPTLILEAQTQHTQSEIDLLIVQVNINKIKNKLEELKLHIHHIHADITTIQETKLNPKAKTPNVHYFIDKPTYKIHGYNITLTITQVQGAIKQSKNNNSQCPDKLNIMHLKHITPLGFAFLTSMFKPALNNNIIPHIWKLANIVLIPKPNKDTDKGTSYRPISLLSVIANTLLPCITASISNTHTQHGYKTKHSTVTATHTLNNTVAVGFNQMAPPA